MTRPHLLYGMLFVCLTETACVVPVQAEDQKRYQAEMAGYVPPAKVLVIHKHPPGAAAQRS